MTEETQTTWQQENTDGAKQQQENKERSWTMYGIIVS